MLARYTKAVFRGHDIYLAYTVSAMFRINDMLNDGDELLTVLDGRDEAGIERFSKAVCILAQSGAKAREAEGHEKPYVPEVEEMCAFIIPAEYMAIKKASIDAIMQGYGREVTNPDEEIDLELSKLEKKQNPPELTS
jgi:hypothetical protein